MMTLTILAAAAAAQAPASYRALGTEPFWSVAVDGRQLRLSEPGKPDVMLLVRTPVRTPRGWRWRTPAITMDAVRAPCSDGMSDRRYADQVTVSFRGRTLKGCGGAPANEVALAGTRWRIASIDGRAVRLGADAVTIDFAGERATGQAGCNRFSAPWSIDGDALTFGPAAMTRRGCIGESETVERRFVALIASPLRIARRGEDQMTLTNAAGTMTLTRR